MTIVSHKVIIDTNLWISFLISKSFQELYEHLAEGKVVLIFSEELMIEFLEAVSRPKFSKIIMSKDIVDLLGYINRFSEFYEVGTVEPICRDPKDDFLLALAKASRADFLITGDQDLLILKTYGKTQILPITEYLSLR